MFSHRAGWWLLVLAACGAPPPQDEIELGTGTTTFEVLRAGQDLELVRGIQGGWHVDVSVRGAGDPFDHLLLEYDGIDVETGMSVVFPADVVVDPSRAQVIDGGWAKVGDRLIFNIATPEEVVGRELEIRLTARTLHEVWEDAAVVRVVDNE